MNFKPESEALAGYAEFLRNNYDSSEYSYVVRILCALGDGVSRASHAHAHTSDPRVGSHCVDGWVVIDSLEGSLRCKSPVKSSQDLPPIQSPSDALNERPPELRTRILLFEIADYTFANRALIAFVGHFYRLGPDWLKPHVQIWDEYHTALTGPYDDLGYHPTFLPPFTSILRITHASWQAITAVVKDIDGYSLVIVLSLDRPPLSWIGHLKEKILQFSTTEITSADQTPVDYLLPLVRTHTTLSSQHAVEWWARIRKGMLKPEPRRLLHLSRDLTQTKVSLIHTIAASPRRGTNDTRITAQIERYSLLVADVKEMMHDTQDHFRNLSNEAAMVEACKSRKLADEVRQLTIVAFIFLPLSFSASFFGMNVQQLGSGPQSPNIAYFFFASLITLVLALSLSPFIYPLTNLIQILLHALVGQNLRNQTTTDCYGVATRFPIFWKNVHKLWFGRRLHAFWLRNRLLAIAAHNTDEGYQPPTREVLTRCFVPCRDLCSTMLWLWKPYSKAKDRDLSCRIHNREATEQPRISSTSLPSSEDTCTEDERRIECLCHCTRSERLRLIRCAWVGCDTYQHVDCFYLGQPTVPMHFCHQHEEISYVNFA